MTREEAIKWLKDYNKNGYFSMPQYREALEMAIQALSQEPCPYSTKDGYCQYDDIAETIPTEQEPCEKCEVGNPCLYCEHEFSQKIEPCDDAISREAAIKVTCNDCKYDDCRYRESKEYCDCCGYIDRLRTLPSVTPKPCDDVISREAVLDTTICEGISCNECSFNEIDGESGCLLHARIEDLPSVTHKSGKWIEEVNDFGEITKYHCSKCYENTGFTTDCKWKFCPNCGARMVEPQESEDKE